MNIFVHTLLGGAKQGRAWLGGAHQKHFNFCEPMGKGSAVLEFCWPQFIRSLLRQKETVCVTITQKRNN